MKQNFWYNSPEAITRKEAVRLLLKECEDQLALLTEMRGGDGRTIKLREMHQKSAKAEERIQKLLAIISDPKTSEGNLQ